MNSERVDVTIRECLLPLRTGRGLNDRPGNHHARARKVKKQRADVSLLWPWRGRAWTFPVLVTLTRISPGTKELDDDNLAGALKAVRDQVAAELGVDDGDKTRIRFAVPLQERGPWGVRIRVESASAALPDQHRQASTHPIPQTAPAPRARTKYGFKVSPNVYRSSR